MQKIVIRCLLLVCALGLLSKVASADQIGVGLLSYDEVAAGTDQFDITNLTGANAIALADPDFPITTQLSFTITSLEVDFASGPALILTGADFTVVDSEGDLDCTSAACNVAGDIILDAILTGTLSPTSGLAGLPAGDTGIAAGFSTTLTPSCDTTLVAGCDAGIIYATGTTGSTPPPGTPEPGTWTLLIIGLAGLALVSKNALAS